MKTFLTALVLFGSVFVWDVARNRTDLDRDATQIATVARLMQAQAATTKSPRELRFDEYTDGYEAWETPLPGTPHGAKFQSLYYLREGVTIASGSRVLWTARGETRGGRVILSDGEHQRIVDIAPVAPGS